MAEEGASSAFWLIISLFLPFPGHRMQTSVGFPTVGDPFGPLSPSPERGRGVQIV